MNFSNEKSPKNYTGITVVVLLHVLAAYGIATGLGKRLVTKMMEPVGNQDYRGSQTASTEGSSTATTAARNESATAAIHSASRGERAAAATTAERDCKYDCREASHECIGTASAACTAYANSWTSQIGAYTGRG